MRTNRREWLVAASAVFFSVASIVYAADDDVVWFHRKCTKCGNVANGKDRVTRKIWETLQKDMTYECHNRLPTDPPKKCGGLVKCELTSPPG
jgi:hypothetical protein